jgi:hypothetical protein
MWRRVAAVRIDVSEERFASIIKVTRMSELGITLAVTSNWSTLRRNAIQEDIVGQDLYLPSVILRQEIDSNV